jgi:hypothetical protein
MKTESLILKALVSKGISINPLEHCPDGHYTDYDEWDSVTVHGVTFDINFYSDGERFYITAYRLFMTASGIYDRDNQDFFHVQVYKLQGAMA